MTCSSPNSALPTPALSSCLCLSSEFFAPGSVHPTERRCAFAARRRVQVSPSFPGIIHLCPPLPLCSGPLNPPSPFHSSSLCAPLPFPGCLSPSLIAMQSIAEKSVTLW